MEKVKEEPKRYNALISINQKIYFFGLAPLQLVIAFFSAGIFVILFQEYAIPFVAIVFFLASIISKQNRKGYPNYLDSLFLKYSARSEFKDTDYVMSKLKKTSWKQ